MVEGFEILGQVQTTLSSGANAFPSNITFTEIPTDAVRTVQVQIYAEQSSTLIVRLNDTDFPVNNNVALIGAITFTIVVRSTDTLNFRTDGTNIDLDIIVSGG